MGACVHDDMCGRVAMLIVLRCLQFSQMRCGERNQREMPAPLDRSGQGALVLGAGTCSTPGFDLAALGHIAADTTDVLVVNLFDLVDTEGAHLTPRNEPVAATAAARSPRLPSSFRSRARCGRHRRATLGSYRCCNRRWSRDRSRGRCRSLWSCCLGDIRSIGGYQCILLLRTVE
jgi:hypothetical protein